MFANHLPRIRVLNGNSGSTGCVRWGEGGVCHYFIFFNTFMFFVAIQAFSPPASFNALSVGNGI